MHATGTYSQQRPSAPATRRPLAGREPALPGRTRAAFRAAVRRSIATVAREEDATLPCLRGAVPMALRGVLYRNGPGSVGVAEDKYRHLFDGDGHITRFELAEGEVKYRNRFVQTAERSAELKAGRMLFRSYGTNPGGPLRTALRMRFKNTANTNVVLHGGQLLALWEGGLPHALDPKSLETRGRHDFAGQLRTRGALERTIGLEAPFCAHPQRDAETGELWAFGLQLSLRPLLRIYAVDSSGSLRDVRQLRLPEMSYVHDFLLTPNHCLFFLSSVQVDVAGLLGGLTTPLDAVSSTDGPTRVLVVPRDSSLPARWSNDLPPGFVYHIVNGWEPEPGHLAVDLLWMREFPGGHFSLSAGSPLLDGKIPPAELRRLTLDVETGRVRFAERLEGPMELPTTHPEANGRRHRFTWLVAAAEQDEERFTSVAKVDDLRRVVRRDLWPLIPSEPVVAPRPGAQREDDAWLLVLCYHAELGQSVLAILDAASLATVAELALPHSVPPTLHGAWIPG